MIHIQLEEMLIVKENRFEKSKAENKISFFD